MHSSLVLLTLVSLALIGTMLTCFFCFVKRRRHEQEDLERQVANSTSAGPQTSLVDYSPSKSALMNNNDLSSNSLQHQQLRGANNTGSGGASLPATASTSPYHTTHAGLSLQQASEQVAGSQTEIRSDMTQQINAAIIGSSEAEFQNDFIQVFPMYQIEPQPDKNTTPYLS